MVLSVRGLGRLEDVGDDFAHLDGENLVAMLLPQLSKLFFFVALEDEHAADAGLDDAWAAGHPPPVLPAEPVGERRLRQVVVHVLEVLLRAQVPVDQHRVEAAQPEHEDAELEKKTALRNNKRKLTMTAMKEPTRLIQYFSRTRLRT